MSSLNLLSELLKQRVFWECTELQLVSEVRSYGGLQLPVWLTHSWPKFLKLNHIYLKTTYLRSFLATWQVNYESFPSDSTYRPGRKKKLDEY